MLKPYYENKYGVLYYGDCLEIMPQLDVKFDMVLTDPPYNISRKNNFQSMSGRKGIDFGEWDKGFDFIHWLDNIPNLLNKNSSIVCFNDWIKLGFIVDKLQSIGFEIKDMIRWEKQNPMPRNIDRRYVTDCEYALWATLKNAKWTFNCQDDNFRRPKFVYPIVLGKEKNEHTTQKPINLMIDLINIHTNNDNHIFDPFAGSGTTGVACIKTNRRFVMIEKEEKYCEICVKRLEQALYEVSLLR